MPCQLSTLLAAWLTGRDSWVRTPSMTVKSSCYSRMTDCCGPHYSARESLCPCSCCMHGPMLLQILLESHTYNSHTCSSAINIAPHAATSTIQNMVYDTLQPSSHTTTNTAGLSTSMTMPEHVAYSVYAAFSLSALTSFPKASSILDICLLLLAIHLRRLKPWTCRSLKTQDCQGQAGAFPPMHPYITSCDPYDPFLRSTTYMSIFLSNMMVDSSPVFVKAVMPAVIPAT